MALENLFDDAQDTMESLLQSLLTHASGGNSEDEHVQLLFHTRFALGLLWLVRSKQEFDLATADPESYLNAVLYKQRATSILHEMAATQLSIKSYEPYESRSGPGIIQWSIDLARAKTTAI